MRRRQATDKTVFLTGHYFQLVKEQTGRYNVILSQESNQLCVENETQFMIFWPNAGHNVRTTALRLDEIKYVS